jgi:signal-transduction protein with cAMP-binding, CBS, and nucleotidyltransferase domain
MNKLETLAGEQLSGALQAASGSDSKSLPFDGRALVEPLPFPSQQGKPDAETLKILSKVTLLQGLDDELLAKIWSSGEIINFEAKQTIINFIENPVGLYLIISGVVRCFRISSNDEHNDNHLGSGKTFGEPWTLSDQIARARFVAEETSKILLIKKERCQELFGREPAIGRTVYKAFSRRLMQHLSGGGSADSFDRVFGL